MLEQALKLCFIVANTVLVVEEYSVIVFQLFLRMTRITKEVVVISESFLHEAHLLVSVHATIAAKVLAGVSL